MQVQAMANCPLYISNPGAHSDDDTFPSLNLQIVDQSSAFSSVS